MKMQGKFTVKQFRQGKLIRDIVLSNGITIVGKNHILDVMFHGTSASSPWYVGLVDNSGFTGFNENDTMSSHGGWTELEDYSESNRQAWDENAASGKIMDSASESEFSMDDTKTVKGIFIASNNTKGGSTGVLWSTAAFDSTVDVVNGDTLRVTYEVVID